MLKYYLKALKSESMAKKLVTQCAEWLKGDYMALDTYDLAQMLFDIALPANECVDVAFLQEILKSSKASRLTPWDSQLCLAIVAVLCNEHGFIIEGV